jgi:prepilin-type N-terminal cleavage/methylation domain-containing protein
LIFGYFRNIYIAMKKMFVVARKNRGFTMIEIVVVLVVLFIVSAVVMSRYTMTGVNELMVEREALKASLRFAQIHSLNDDTITSGWGIHFPNNSSYILYKNGSPAGIMIPVKDPDPVKDPPPNNTHALQGNVRITSGVGTTVAFDKWGSPGSSTVSITLTKGTESDTITVTKNTGYIP